MDVFCYLKGDTYYDYSTSPATETIVDHDMCEADIYFWNENAAADAYSLFFDVKFNEVEGNKQDKEKEKNQNIKENFLDDADIAYIKPDFAAKYHTKTLRENDLLIVRTGYPGVACLVPRKYEGAQTFTTLIARLKDCERTNPVYICHFINSEFGKQFVESKKVGIAQQNFGAKALGEMPMLIPDVALQHEFAAFVAEVDKSEFAVRKSLEELQKLYRQQLQEAFG